MTEALHTARERTETLIAGPAEGLAGLLGAGMSGPDTEGCLPALWHWVYLLERPSQSELGQDGHPLTGIPAPPEAGMRRMFAGGRVRSHGKLRYDEPATRTTQVVDSTTKQGRSGTLTFLTVQHEIRQRGELAVTEQQDIVYLPSTSRPASGNATPPVPEGDRGREVLSVLADAALLFRFSALTFNAHRIHYDREYAAREGYDGLVVHGPLQALLMAEALRGEGFEFVGSQFRYRLVAPLLAVQQVSACVLASDGVVQAQVRDAAGRATATALLEP